MGPRQVARHVLPDGPGAGDRGRDRRSAGLAISCTVGDERLQDAQHVADVLRRRRDHQLLLEVVHARARRRHRDGDARRRRRLPRSAALPRRRRPGDGRDRAHRPARERVPVRPVRRRSHDAADDASSSPARSAASAHGPCASWSARASRSSPSTSGAIRVGSPRSSIPTRWTGSRSSPATSRTRGARARPGRPRHHQRHPPGGAPGPVLPGRPPARCAGQRRRHGQRLRGRRRRRGRQGDGACRVHRFDRDVLAHPT